MNTVDSLASTPQQTRPGSAVESRSKQPSQALTQLPDTGAMERLTALAAAIAADDPIQGSSVTGEVITQTVATETPQRVLINRARQGSARAIAELMQRDLRHHGIEVSAWTRGKTLRLEMVSRRVLRKPEALAFIRNGMDFLQADGIDAVQISAYVEGEYDPRWVERLNLKLPPKPRVQVTSSDRPRLKLGFSGPGVVAIAASTALVFSVAIASLSASQSGSANTQDSPKPTDSLLEP